MQMSMSDVFRLVDSKHCMTIHIYDYAYFCDDCGSPFVYGCLLTCDKFQFRMLFAMVYIVILGSGNLIE